MPEDDAQSGSQPPSEPVPQPTPSPELYGSPEPPPVVLDEAVLRRIERGDVGVRRGSGSLGRLISVIVSVGLAWALVVGITAWLLGLFLTRG
jgi:hypothetical protein